MKIYVEFSGLAKEITKKQEIDLTLSEKATYHDIVRTLGKQFPGLIGILIAEDGETFLSSNMFVIDGDLANPAMILESSPKDGERLHLMSVITGG